MNKSILKFATLGLVVGSLVFTGCKKDDSTDPITTGGGNGNTTGDDNKTPELVVPTTSVPIINKLTATWCGPCGSWGWELMGDLIDQVGEKAIIMGTYGSSSSKMYNSTAQVFKTQFAPTAGWPAFCVNGKNETQYSSNGGIYTGQTLTQCVNVVENFVGETPDVQTGYRYTVKDGKINVETKTKFFNAGKGNYYLGVYVIEDGVIEYQNGQGNNAKHHDVLRDAGQELPWGTKIAEGDVEAGTTFDNNFTINVDSKWNMDNIHVAVIMWNKNIYNKYIFVNANNHAQVD